MASKMFVSVGQALSRPGDLSTNLSLAQRWAEEACSRGAAVLCLPELFDWGYDLEAIRRSGASEQSLELSRISQNAGIPVIAGLALEEGGTLYNASVHFLPDGSREVYHKVHLFEGEPHSESRVFSPGGRRASWNVAGRPAAPLVCYDLRFPELARASSLAGAEILFVSSAWPAARREVFRVLCQARAIENQLFVVSANLCGQNPAGHFAGHSMVVAPDGKILCEAGEGEALLLSELDFSLLAKARSFLPCFQQRKPETY